MPDARTYQTAEGVCPFDKWFFRLDPRAAAKVRRTVLKLEAGLRPDVKGVGEGVQEARIDFGPGYRVYFGLDGVTLVILLGGGDKGTQSDDIPNAQRAWADYRARKKEGKVDHGTHP